jgi:hypothetical protein
MFIFNFAKIHEVVQKLLMRTDTYIFWYQEHIVSM